MKLEGKLAFFNSKSFDFNDNDLDSAAYKSQNQKVREYENRVSMNALDLDLSHGMESADCRTPPKLNFSNGVLDLKNNFEPKGMEFFQPISHSPKDIEMRFLKRSPRSPVSDPSKEMNSFESSVDVYMDKSVTESAPKLTGYKESNYHVVKDICIDEGAPTLEKLLFGNVVNASKDNKLSPSESFRNKELQNDNNVINVLNVTATEESDQVSATHVLSNDLIHKDEVVTEKPLDNVHKEMVLPEENLPLQDSDIQEPRPSLEQQVSGEPKSNTNSEDSENMIEEAELPTAYPLPLPVDELNKVNKLLEDRSLTYHFHPSVTATSGITEISLVGDSERNETPAITSQGRYSLGESSFSAAGPVSGRISYSGPVPYSGSISIRSDSSTTSTRSFAFPVLQSEWCSSPVRMAKADKRSYRKHRGSKLLCCCRF